MVHVPSARYAHTNLIAHDWQNLAQFYERVFGCVRVPPERDQHGEWLERATAVQGARLRGVHLRLPGHGPQGPTLEIYQYAEVLAPPVANRAGLGHLAFAVEDVDAALAAVVLEGGHRVGEVVAVHVAGAGHLRFTYACDPERNLLELQSWT